MATSKYVVRQVTLREDWSCFKSKSSVNSLSKLEKIINEQCDLGYRLHTCSTTESTSKGFLGGDRIQATLIFERIE